MRKAATTLRQSVEEKQAAAFGQAIYQLRMKAELSQEELAFRSQVGRSYLGVVERGQKEPCLGVIFRLAKALGVSLADIFTLTEHLYSAGPKRPVRNARVR